MHATSSGLNVPASTLHGPLQVYLTDLAPGTRGDARRQLDTIAKILRPGSDAVSFPWWELTYKETTLVRGVLAERMHYRYANQHLYSLRSVLRAAFNLGLMDASTYLMAVSFKPLKGRSAPAGRQVREEEFARLFRHIAEDRSIHGIRDLAMLGTLHATGMRAISLRKLRVDSYDPASHVFVAIGKGNVEHVVAAAPWTIQPMADWLRVRGSRPGALFCKVHPKGAIDRHHRPLAHSTLDYVHHKRRREAGVARFTLHDYRRSLASMLFEKNVDPGTIRDQLGHVNLATTSLYDRRGHQRLRGALQVVGSPLHD